MQKIWNIYWSKIETLNVERVIESDSYYRLLKRLIDLSQGNLSILEVGSGNGIRTLALLREFQGEPLNVTFIDFSSIALAFAKKNADGTGITANFILADALKLPFPDKSFDIVWNEGVNEHFDGEKRQLIFNEMARVCKRGGQVIVIVPNALNPFYRLWKGILEIKGRWEYGLEKPFTIFELKNRMKNAGLVPTNASGIEVISPVFRLAGLITRKHATQPAKAKSKKYVKSGVLWEMPQRTERILERILWFAGGNRGNIGVKGIKCD